MLWMKCPGLERNRQLVEADLQELVTDKICGTEHHVFGVYRLLNERALCCFQQYGIRFLPLGTARKTILV